VTAGNTRKSWSQISKVVWVMGSPNAHWETEIEVDGHLTTNVGIWIWRLHILVEHCHLGTLFLAWTQLNGIPSQRFKTASSASKVLLTSFWDVIGVVHSEFIQAPRLTLSTTLKCCKSLRHIFEEFLPTWSSFPSTWQHEISFEHMKTCRDLSHCYHCLWLSTIPPRLGSIWFPSLPETEGTSEST
jgi:hypothetical protein